MNLPKNLNFKKIALVFFFLLFFSFLIPRSFVFSAAETPYYNLSPEGWREAIVGPDKKVVSKERIERHGDYGRIYNMTSWMVCWPLKEKECDVSATSSLGTMIATLYNHPPASSVYYLAYLGENLGIVDKAYAQGLGFPGLSPILNLWKVFRNLAYLVLVIIMVVLGFMIMFRTKINPQTVISIQNALPRIAVTLLLITFSYAIAGLLIDLMYLSILLVVSILAQSGMIEKPEVVKEYYMSGGLPNLIGAVFSGGGRSLFGFAKAFFPTIQMGLIETIMALTVAFSPTGPVGLGGAILGAAIIPGLVVFIIALALLFTLIRIFLILLTSYVQIILLVIFGPIQVLMGALPGRNDFLSWLLSLMGNLIVFPATAALLLIATILTSHDVTQNIWQPPLIGGAAGGKAIIAFIGLGMVLITPSLVSKIKAAFQPKPALPISPMAPIAPLLGATQTTLGVASQFYYMQQVARQIPALGRLLGQGGRGGPQPTFKKG